MPGTTGGPAPRLRAALAGVRLRAAPPADARSGSGPGSTCCGRSGRSRGWRRSPRRTRSSSGSTSPSTSRRSGGCRRTRRAPGAMGIGLSDNPSFAGMHEASARRWRRVAARRWRRSSAATVEHAHQPGGGLHHAMPDQAWGFCIYNDPALAIVRARAEGLRVLYLDLDVHHGDGVQVMTYEDPGVLTRLVARERPLPVPGDRVHRRGGGGGGGRDVGQHAVRAVRRETALARVAVRALLPTLAAVFGPDVIVSQHGADSHAWDPLAHLRVTTTAMREAARLVDAVAHRWAGGRWLATGGGGYDAYRVVPRAWALTWLAGAHREPARETPRGLAGAVGGRGGRVRHAGDAVDVPRRAERRAAGRDAAAGGGRARRWTTLRAGAGGGRCRGWCARRRTGAGGGRRSRGPVGSCSRGPRRRAACASPDRRPSGDPPVVRALGAAELARLRLCPASCPAVRPGRRDRAAAGRGGGRRTRRRGRGRRRARRAWRWRRRGRGARRGVAARRRRGASFRGAGLGRALLARSSPGGRRASRCGRTSAWRSATSSSRWTSRSGSTSRGGSSRRRLRARPVSPDVRRDDPWAIAAVLRPG